MNLDKLANHLARAKYGAFWLTEAIRPSPVQSVVPQEGYRLATYQDARSGLRVPMLAAAVSRERLFDLFLTMIEPLGETVDLVLETSHASKGGRHQDLHREGIDRPVLASHLCDFEDLLLNDGYTGIAVMSASEPLELQFDEHKLLLVYGRDLRVFEDLARQAGLSRNNQLQLITEGNHLHRSQTRHQDAFQQLCYRLGVGESAEHVNW